MNFKEEYLYFGGFENMIDEPSMMRMEYTNFWTFDITQVQVENHESSEDFTDQHTIILFDEALNIF